MTRLTEELEARGCEVVVATTPPDDMGAFDVVHGVNLDRSVLGDTAAFGAAARAAGAPFVLTPLWWPLRTYIAGLDGRDHLRHSLAGTPPARFLRERRVGALLSTRRRQGDLLHQADVVCPSGSREAEALRLAFGEVPMVPVHYGTGVSPLPVAQRRGVLCVARIDPRKNQLNLIRAVNETGLSLRLVGTPDVFPRYARRCRSEAGPNVVFCGFLPGAALLEELRSARVHALPSAFELPGLTSLDAGAAGGAIVASTEGTALDYFGEAGAWYTDTSPGSIRAALVAADAAGPPPGGAERIAATFTWSATARAMTGVYESVMG